ncbi:MAG: phosphate acyltransferase, partial [Rhodospirillales bacterium]|nr:phosphate acyltransferase [Rhodospirillales bacterium]
MVEHLKLSVDAMGGDDAPRMVIEGIDLLAARLPNVKFLLFGDEPQLGPLLERFSHAQRACEVRHAPQIIKSDDKPASALRGGRESSMRLAINAVSDGEAAGVVSAGNTGALMAIAKFVLKTLPG